VEAREVLVVEGVIVTLPSLGVLEVLVVVLELLLALQHQDLVEVTLQMVVVAEELPWEDLYLS
jgi:hypothetical protein